MVLEMVCDSDDEEVSQVQPQREVHAEDASGSATQLISLQQQMDAATVQSLGCH